MKASREGAGHGRPKAYERVARREAAREALLSGSDDPRWVNSPLRKAPGGPPPNWWELKVVCHGRILGLFGMAREHPAASPGQDPLILLLHLGAPPFGELSDAEHRQVPLKGGGVRMEPGDKVTMRCPKPGCRKTVPLSYARTLALLRLIRAEEGEHGRRRREYEAEAVKQIAV